MLSIIFLIFITSFIGYYEVLIYAIRKYPENNTKPEEKIEFIDILQFAFCVTLLLSLLISAILQLFNRVS